MNSSATHCHRAIMAAASLNNIGVSLLERNCHQAAIRIFSEAIAILKSVSSSKASHMRQRTPDKYAFEDQLERAKHELASALEESSKCMNFCIFSEEDCFAVVSSAIRKDMAASMMNPFDTIYLIRIEMRGRSIRDCHNVDLESSIILNNFGICYSCCAQNGTDTVGDSFAFLHGAYRLFELAHSLLHSRSAHDYVLPMSILMLRNLVELASVLGMERDAEAHYEDLLEQQEFLLAMDEFSGESSFIAAAAAPGKSIMKTPKPPVIERGPDLGQRDDVEA